MEIREILTLSWKEYRKELISIIKATAPFLICSICLEVAEPYLWAAPTLFQTLVLQLTFTLLNAGVLFLGLKYLFERNESTIEITNGRILVYVVSSIYVSIAIILGLLLLVVPGLIVLAGTYLMPIYVLKEKQGPIEAVVSSLQALKPIIFRLIGLFLLFFLVLFAFSYSILVLPDLVSSILSSLLLALITLFGLFFMFNLYSEIQSGHNQASNADVEDASS